MLTVSTPDLHKLGGFPLFNNHKKEILRQFLDAPAPRKDCGGYTRDKYVPFPRWLGEELRKLITAKVHESTYVIICRSLKQQRITKVTAQQILTLLQEHNLTCTHPRFKEWCAFVNCESVHFEFVKSIDVTEQVEDGYDLTVPGYETFMSLDGVILSNTLQIHVPATDAAMKEMRSLTMSNLLFGDKTRSDLMVFPQHEAILGVHLATQPSGPGAKTHTFKTKEEAMEAYHRGEVGLTDIIHLG